MKGKIICYTAFAVMIIGAVVDRFFYRFPTPVYIGLLIVLVGVGCLSVLIDKKNNKE